MPMIGQRMYPLLTIADKVLWFSLNSLSLSLYNNLLISDNNRVILAQDIWSSSKQLRILNSHEIPNIFIARYSIDLITYRYRLPTD